MANPRPTLQPMSAERAVRELLAEITLNAECLSHSREAPLEMIGVNSVAMIELVYALEDRFDIRIGDDEVAPENFASIGTLTTLVARKCRS
jgi:acyl carrier protein